MQKGESVPGFPSYMEPSWPDVNVGGNYGGIRNTGSLS
jgi:hypothetical protein